MNVEAYEAGVLAGDRTVLGRALTLVESRRADHQDMAQELLLRLLPKAGGSHRVGITGVPGVGKSTFIDALGSQLTGAGHRVAVLAVDPSSSRTGGSILGDKTRMARLSTDPQAFIRPSPTTGTLGGVAAATRESIVVMEAAGYDVVLVETVGVGQSEITVANMTDTFLVLMLARTGDSLQGIKKGVLEIADVIAVNKADGEFVKQAESAAGELATALQLLYASDAPWVPPVLTCSAATGAGLHELWAEIERHRTAGQTAGRFESRRAEQRIGWMWATVEDRLVSAFKHRPEVRAAAADLESQLRDGTLTPALAARRLLELR